MTPEERRQLVIQDNQLAILSGAVTIFPKIFISYNVQGSLHPIPSKLIANNPISVANFEVRVIPL